MEALNTTPVQSTQAISATEPISTMQEASQPENIERTIVAIQAPDTEASPPPNDNTPKRKRKRAEKTKDNKSASSEQNEASKAATPPPKRRRDGSGMGSKVGWTKEEVYSITKLVYAQNLTGL